MSSYKKALIFTVILCLLAGNFPAYAQTKDLAPTAESAVLMECNSNTLLYEKNAEKRLPMASTTKIMTALTVLRFFSADTEMTVPSEAVGIEGTSACLEAGEVYSLKELLYALLLQSANDAAVVIAVNAAGSVDGFATLMNDTAKQLGLSDSNFKNPHGLPEDEHYTTARELALISSYALKNDCIREITSSKNAKIVSAQGRIRYFSNHNKLLSSYSGANGVKTGYTKASGRCLVSGANRDGLQLIAVTLHSHDDWKEHTAMLDYGFSEYMTLRLSDVCPLSIVIPVAGMPQTAVNAAAEDVGFTVRRADSDKITVKCECRRFVYSPINENTVLGRYICYCNGKMIACSEIRTTHKA